MVLDYLECKIGLREDSQEERHKIEEEVEKQARDQADPVDLDFNKQLEQVRSPSVIDKYTYYDHRRHNILSSEAFRSTVRTSLQGTLQIMD